MYKRLKADTLNVKQDEAIYKLYQQGWYITRQNKHRTKARIKHVLHKRKYCTYYIYTCMVYAAMKVHYNKYMQ